MGDWGEEQRYMGVWAPHTEAIDEVLLRQEEAERSKFAQSSSSDRDPARHDNGCLGPEGVLMDAGEFIRRAKSYSSTIDLRDVVDDWGARWSTVMQQAKYGKLGGVASRHYSECREHPEYLAEYLKNAFPVHEDAIQEALDAIAYCECRRQQVAPTDPTGALGWSYAREDAERLAQRMLELP